MRRFSEEVDAVTTASVLTTNRNLSVTPRGPAHVVAPKLVPSDVFAIQGYYLGMLR